MLEDHEKNNTGYGRMDIKCFITKTDRPATAMSVPENINIEINGKNPNIAQMSNAYFM